MKNNPMILFIGTEQSAETLREENTNWEILQPEAVMEALAWYTFYFPDLVIIEDASEDAHEVFAHLRSIGAENILLLTDEPFRWVDDTFEPYCLPLDSSAQEIALVVKAWNTPDLATILRGTFTA